MNPIEILRGLRSPKIVWDLNAVHEHHISYYETITTKQLSMIVRPYPSGWTMPKKWRYLWLPSASLLKQVADITASERTQESDTTNQPVETQLPLLEVPTTALIQHPEIKPAEQTATEPTFVEYTPTFKQPKRRISRFSPYGP
ncbi:Uncharacterized protein APZ42_019104 [Daphnia magna]|uniref:Uncharacterized protein n=1 Tax=Daphnia magna TaxID=35525 RepID=A0A0P6APW6_9CRUS|nr:Uncharacterized protein APZ42_019104 [Daphnia magna]